MSLDTFRPAQPGFHIRLSHIGRGAEILKKERGDTAGYLEEVLTGGGDFGGHDGRRARRKGG